MKFKKKQEPSMVVNVRNQQTDDNKNNPNKLSFQVRESYKTARTNIIYSIIKKGCKKIVITSSNKGEGKSSTAFNLSCVLAQEVDVRVLLVECDLRRPHVHSMLNISHNPGITNFLNNENDIDDIIKETHIDNLKAICYGDAIPPNPSELLASSAMYALIEKLETLFDYIIFDTPPVGVVIDAIPIIKNSDGVVVIVKNDATTYPQFDRTMDILKRSDSKILGVIVNAVDTIKSKKYKNYKYGYGGYGYYGY